jgi:hypothetical protein
MSDNEIRENSRENSFDPSNHLLKVLSQSHEEMMAYLEELATRRADAQATTCKLDTEINRGKELLNRIHSAREALEGKEPIEGKEQSTRGWHVSPSRL